MPRRVYQFGLLPPTDGADQVRAQLRAAHEYRNDLVAIERGRRTALRAVTGGTSLCALGNAVFKRRRPSGAVESRRQTKGHGSAQGHCAQGPKKKGEKSQK